MDLVLSLFARKTNLTKQFNARYGFHLKVNALRALVAFSIVLFCSQVAHSAESFDTYENLSHRIMNLIGNSKDRVWLRTTYMTDGNLAMGLNLAKFRDVDVKVVLHSKRAKHYMSRYTTLRKQRIPTSISGESWSHPTSLLVDNNVFHISTAMNYKTGSRYIRLNKLTGKKVAAFEKDFMKNVQFKNYRRSSPKKSMTPIKRSNTTGGKASESVYTYTNKKKKAPKGVQTKLPRKTKWQLNR